MIKKIGHIAIAVNSIEEASKFYTDGLGLVVSQPEVVPSQKVKVAFIQVGEVRIELLEPTSPDSTVAGFLKKKGQGLHHVCYEVDSIDKELNELQRKNIRLIDNEAREGAHGARIAFVHPKSSGSVLTELAEIKE